MKSNNTIGYKDASPLGNDGNRELLGITSAAKWQEILARTASTSFDR